VEPPGSIKADERAFTSADLSGMARRVYLLTRMLIETGT
jgi:hypothetical protein